MSAVLTVGEYAAATTAILALLGVLFRYLVLFPLKAYIKELTYPIQPFANAGKSLPDVARGVERIESRLESIERRVMRLEDTPEKRLS